MRIIEYSLFGVILFVTRIRYSLHEYTGISQLKSPRCSSRCTMVCKFKLSKWQIAHKDKYSTKTAHVSSSICQCSPISLASFSLAQLTVRTRCLRHLQVERDEAAIVVQNIQTDIHTSCSIQCIISLPFCSERTCESINERISDICTYTAATRAAAAQPLPTHSSGIIIN